MIDKQKDEKLNQRKKTDADHARTLTSRTHHRLIRNRRAAEAYAAWLALAGLPVAAEIGLSIGKATRSHWEAPPVAADREPRSADVCHDLPLT